MSIYLPREVGNFAGLALFQSSGGLGWVGLAPLIVIFAIFYFLLIMPQQRRQKKWQQMLSQVKTEDKVVISLGLCLTIIVLKNDYVHLRVLRNQLRAELSNAPVVLESPDEPTNE